MKNKRTTARRVMSKLMAPCVETGFSPKRAKNTAMYTLALTGNILDITTLHDKPEFFP